MNILVSLLRIFAVIIIGGALVYFFGGSVMLAVETTAMRADIMTMLGASKNVERYTKMCQEAPSSSGSSRPIGFQIRFIDRQRYAIEIVCSLIESTPVMIEEKKLLPLVYHEPGSAGLFVSIDGDETSSVALESLGKRSLVTVINGEMRTTVKGDALVGEYPKTVCASYGYVCCENGTQAGNGNKQTLALDCAGNCYVSCEPLPFVDLFTSDPPQSPTTHELEMKGETMDVVFNYGVQTAGIPIKKVKIDYGDGKSEEATQDQGLFTHTFSCPGACRFSVTVAVETVTGKESIASETSTIYIVKK